MFLMVNQLGPTPSPPENPTSSSKRGTFLEEEQWRKLFKPPTESCHGLDTNELKTVETVNGRIRGGYLSVTGIGGAKRRGKGHGETERNKGTAFPESFYLQNSIYK